MSLQQLQDTMRSLAAYDDESFIRQSLLRTIKDLITSDAWVLPEFCELSNEQDWILHTVFSEPTNTPMTAFVTAWKPNGYAPPHTHGSWAIIAGIRGQEKNTLWKRMDDRSREGYAEITPDHDIDCRAGDIIVMEANDIHSVHNPADSISIGLHVYGNHPDRATREFFDVENKTVSPFKTIPAA